MARARFHRPGLASQSPSILWLSRSARTIAHSHARARRAPCVKLPVTHSAQAIKNTANQHLVRYALHDARGLTDFVVAFAVLRKSCGHAPRRMLATELLPPAPSLTTISVRNRLSFSWASKASRRSPAASSADLAPAVSHYFPFSGSNVALSLAPIGVELRAAMGRVQGEHNA